MQDIDPGPYSSGPSMKYIFKDKLVFCAVTAANGWEIWSYNDTIATMIYDFPNGSSGSSWTGNTMATANGKLYFGAEMDTLGYELRGWDGINPPALVKDIRKGKDHSGPMNIIAHDNKIYFVSSAAYYGEELWVHDPATNSTRQLSNTDPNRSIARPPMYTTVFNNKIFFTATTDSGIHIYICTIQYWIRLRLHHISPYQAEV